MEKEKIARINELAKKRKTVGLTEEEQAEQAALRAEYLTGFRESLKDLLDHTLIQEPDGTRHALRRKDNP